MTKRRVLVCFLAAAMVLSLSVTTVLAASSTEELTTNPGNIYGRSAQELLSDAVSPDGIVTPRVELLNINLSVSPFVQTSQLWGDDIMQTCGSTIGTKGCALTSTAMLAKYYGDSSIDPGTLNTSLGNNACPMNWWAVPNASSYISSLDTTLDHPSTNSAISVMRNALQADEPIVLGYQKHEDSEHYVLVKAVYNYGTQLSDFYCIDPLDGVTYNLYTLIGTKSITRIACYYQ